MWDPRPSKRLCCSRPIRLLNVLAVALVGWQSAEAATTRPNVILIVTDDQGYGDMSCHGNPYLTTPNLDRLASESIRLSNYHVDPVCTPTRAALMTGRYCTRVGAWAVTEGRQLLDPDETTMANVFAASDYRTAMFGKWHLGDPYPFAPRYRGFQHVVRHLAGGVDEIGNPIGNDFIDDKHFRNGVPEQFNGYCTDVWFDEAIDFIRSGEEQPFFAYLATNAMHSPHTVPEKYSAPFARPGVADDRAKFYGMIVNFDENLGRLMAALDEMKLQEDTLLIFMGDNGTAQGASETDRSDGFNAGMRGKKGSVYEGGHRVACFVRWPAKWEIARDVDQLTCHRDWLPTLIELCDLKSPVESAFDGRSIVSLLDGEADDWPDRTLVVERQRDQPVNAARATGRARPSYVVMNQRWRLIGDELYDILLDPGQRQDLAGQNPDVVEALQQDYDRYYDDVQRDRKDFIGFLVAAQDDNSSRMTVRDWHPTQGNVIWQQSQLSDDSLAINGFWAIDVVQAGRYRIRLSRYPDDALQPIGADHARIEVGEIEMSQSVSPNDEKVTFEMELPAGKLKLETWLRDAKTGKTRGAYFAEFELVLAAK